MNIPPDARQSITDRVIAKSKSMALVKLRELDEEGKRLRTDIKDVQMRLALYCGKVSAALEELRKAQEDTTVRLPRLPTPPDSH